MKASVLPDGGKLCVCTDGCAMWFGTHDGKKWLTELFEDICASPQERKRFVKFWMYVPELPK